MELFFTEIVDYSPTDPLFVRMKQRFGPDDLLTLHPVEGLCAYVSQTRYLHEKVIRLVLQLGIIIKEPTTPPQKAGDVIRLRLKLRPHNRSTIFRE